MCLEVDSLLALSAVIETWQSAKHGNAAALVPRMREVQKQHVACFVKSYGVNLVRPKLHYSLHLPDQWLKKKKSFDAFPTERKHKYYKSHIAPRLKKLSTLNQVALLELGENDLKIQEHNKSVSTELILGLAADLSEPVLKLLEREGMQVSKQLQHKAVIHGRGQYKLLPNDKALEVMAAVERKGAYFLLGNALQLESKKNIHVHTLVAQPRATRAAAVAST